MEYNKNDGGETMTMQAVSIKIPDTIAEYTLVEDEHDALTRNAMILFPYIKKRSAFPWKSCWAIRYS